MTRAAYAELPGWAGDDQAEALGAFLRTCARIGRWPDERTLGAGGIAGRVADWRPLCEEAETLPAGDQIRARRFFEERFTPFAAADNEAPEGLFTGYYEPELRGSRQRSERYDVPLYARPADLVTVDLGLFRPELRGRSIAGRIVEGRLQPFAARSEIEAGALAGQGLEILWVDDAIDAFFLQVQGSGRVVLEDGSTVRVGYGGKNGRLYTAIGRELVQRGALAQDAVSLPAIRAWLEAHPAEAAQVMAANESFVFFRLLDTEGSLGAHGSVLTPGRSLAVDRAFIPLGVPLWLATTRPAAEPEGPERTLQRLFIAQDTGAAITGPVRGDVFWGPGAEAEAIAGHMRSTGRYWLLLPRTVAAQGRIVAQQP